MEYAPVLAVVFGYALGSISFSYVLGRLVAGIDIRKHGSGNAGATNTLRLLGKGPAIIVLFLDVLKGCIAVFVARLVSDDPHWAIAAGLAAVIGHNWPIFFGFNGGKGVATTIGIVIMLFIWPGILAGIVAILTIALFRYVSLGSLVFVTLLPLFMVLFNLFNLGQYPYAYVYGAVALMILSFWRHRSNIVRLVRGTENKLGGKS